MSVGLSHHPRFPRASKKRDLDETSSPTPLPPPHLPSVERAPESLPQSVHAKRVSETSSPWQATTLPEDSGLTPQEEVEQDEEQDEEEDAETGDDTADTAEACC
ncbi:hypothetical protein Ct61P_15474 [Colletotrichum tofieldiae]|nr:hypothetical protein Ct61P_15474 [Colletotrichum tofieldiae]